MISETQEGDFFLSAMQPVYFVTPELIKRSAGDQLALLWVLLMCFITL